MNGIDAVVMATGNDWRAIEAGAHAYAARDGLYRSLSTWTWLPSDPAAGRESALVGSVELPLAVGIVGGATRVHPLARLALAIMGVGTARELAEIIASVGLAQNLAAIRALATEGIQRGHMALHARQVAIAAGAARRGGPPSPRPWWPNGSSHRPGAGDAGAVAGQVNVSWFRQKLDKPSDLVRQITEPITPTCYTDAQLEKM